MLGLGIRFLPCQLAPYQVLPMGAPEEHREPGKEEETCTFLVAFCEFCVCLQFLPAHLALPFTPAETVHSSSRSALPLTDFPTPRELASLHPSWRHQHQASCSSLGVCVPACGSPPLSLEIAAAAEWQLLLCLSLCSVGALISFNHFNFFCFPSSGGNRFFFCSCLCHDYFVFSFWHR